MSASDPQTYLFRTAKERRILLHHDAVPFMASKSDKFDKPYYLRTFVNIGMLGCCLQWSATLRS